MQLEKGQSFGGISFFTGKPYSFNIRSSDFTTLLKINRNDFLRILLDFPEDYQRYCVIKDSINLYSDYSLIGMKCFSCGRFDHLFI